MEQREGVSSSSVLVLYATVLDRLLICNDLCTCGISGCWIIMFKLLPPSRVPRFHTRRDVCSVSARTEQSISFLHSPPPTFPAFLSSMSAALSEKAKGKQRAVESEAATTPPPKDLTIRFTEGIPDLTLQVAEKDTVKDVKAKVRCH